MKFKLVARCLNQQRGHVPHVSLVLQRKFYLFENLLRDFAINYTLANPYVMGVIYVFTMNS